MSGEYGGDSFLNFEETFSFFHPKVIKVIFNIADKGNKYRFHINLRSNAQDVLIYWHIQD